MRLFMTHEQVAAGEPTFYAFERSAPTNHPRAERVGELAAWGIIGTISLYIGREVFHVLSRILRGREE
jgi:hypothetical protein